MMKKTKSIAFICLVPLFIFWGEPKVNNLFIKSVSQNAREIKSIDSEDYSDLHFFKTMLSDKRIVFLGESSHYVQENNKLKARLIKYLTRELGYRMVAFESPMAELFYYNENVDKVPADSILKNGIYHMWHTKDNLELISYFKKEDIALVGFDIQINSYRVILKYIREELKIVLDQKSMERFIKLDSTYITGLSAKKNVQSANKLKDTLVMEYDVLLKQLENNKDKLKHDRLAKLIKVVKNKKFLTRSYGVNYSASMRDSLMAENITWMLNELYKEEKIIVWGHNYHIMKDYPVKIQKDRKIMGAELDSTIKKQSYFIGFYFNRGNVIYNDQINKVKLPHNNSLEAILHTSGFQYTFIDFNSMPDNNFNSWIYQPIETLYSGYYIDDRIILSEAYDGIIQIDSVSPSIVINYKN